jgi:molybdate transport system substrate-binding protein
MIARTSLACIGRLLPALLAGLLPSACSQAEVDTGPVVLAAASMQDALEEEADAWAAQGHARPVLSFAATSALARQVEAGAPADLLVSADEEWMDRLIAEGHIAPETRRNLAGNRLVLVAQAGQPLTLSLAPGVDLIPLLGAYGRLAIAEPEAVPAGRYGRAALTTLGAWPQVAGRLAIAESVRGALALVARGEAPLGVVYATDAQVEPDVQVAGVFAADTHPPIRYPMAQLATSTHPDAAGFAEFLVSPDGQAIMARHGFTAAEAP